MSMIKSVKMNRGMEHLSYKEKAERIGFAEPGKVKSASWPYWDLSVPEGVPTRKISKGLSLREDCEGTKGNGLKLRG